VKEPDGTTRTLDTTSGPDDTFEFTAPLTEEGKCSFVASFQGDVKYEASTTGGAHAEARQAPVPVLLYATAAAGAVIIITAIAILLRRRERAAPKT